MFQILQKHNLWGDLNFTTCGFLYLNSVSIFTFVHRRKFVEGDQTKKKTKMFNNYKRKYRKFHINQSKLE